MFNIADHREMQIKTTLRCYSHLSEWIVSKRQITIVAKDIEKRNPSCTAGGHVNWWKHYKK